MTVERKSGILLHPTCLPNTPGIGTIGKEAYKFVDDDLEHIHSEKEWVDENGHLRIPFPVDDSLNGHMFLWMNIMNRKSL